MSALSFSWKAWTKKPKTYICKNCGGTIIYQPYKAKYIDSVHIVKCPGCGETAPELGGAKFVNFKKAPKGGKNG